MGEVAINSEGEDMAIGLRIHDGIPTRELTYPTGGIKKSSSKVLLKWDMLVPRRVM